MTAERWTTRRLGPAARGAREGWWGVGPGAEAFLDQLVTWRELGFNLCVTRADHNRDTAVPDWARRTLARHRRDRRPHRYTPAELEAARTHDRVWNAAQRQMLAEGWFHNSLRMLSAERILEWSESAEAAGIDTMIALMNRHAPRQGATQTPSRLRSRASAGTTARGAPSAPSSGPSAT